MITKPKPLTPYYGGKSIRLSEIIVSKLPAHDIYVEPFFGMGGVLMCKKPASIEVVNDLSSGVTTLFKVVRDPFMCQELIRLLELTPYSREEWQYCNQTYNSLEWSAIFDEVEKARIVYTLLSQSFNGTLPNSGWSFGGVKHKQNPAKEFYETLKNIPAVTKRLRSVQIDCQDALTVMKRWDSPETLFYLDPPYVLSTRGKKNKGRHQYEHEMLDDQHQALLDFCLNGKGKFVLSGYDSELYNDTLAGAGWVTDSFEAFATSAVYTDANGLKGMPQEMTKRVETLWFSPNAAPRTLWNLESEAI